jgi:uncharacterized membrane protein YkgB
MVNILKLKLIEVIEWKARNGLTILRISLGFIFIWYGVLKFFPGVSIAETIASDTISTLLLAYLHLLSPCLY